MPQLFSPASNTLARASIVVVLLLAGGGAWAWNTFYWSPYQTGVGEPLDQPIPFSHKHHVAEVGIDCRFCHNTVETSSFAGMPSTETCMTCHSQIWSQAPMLEPVRQSYATGQPLRWNRVHDLPDFVYFNHGIHVNRGVGCTTCHGQVDQMPLTWKSETLYMKWCVECHRQPERFLRERADVFATNWQPPEQPTPQAIQRAHAFHLDARSMTDCTACHR
jgi:hypothetical protein